VREFSWLSEAAALVKVPLTPHRVPDLDVFLAQNGALRRYTVGANLAWVAWTGTMDPLELYLQERQLSGLVVIGPAGRSRLGLRTGDSFTRRVKQALDPSGRWLEA
jgi:hypothetical protein